jgi:hypothetical protein
MKDYNEYLNKQAEILNEFDDFCNQFEKRASESFINPKESDDRFKILNDRTEDGITPPTIIREDIGIGGNSANVTEP